MRTGTMKMVAMGLLLGGAAAQAQTSVSTDGGTTYRIPKFSGTGTITNSAITELNGKVGIGTSSPAATFDVPRYIGSGPLMSLGAGRFLNYVPYDLHIDGNPGPSGVNGMWISSGTGLGTASAFSLYVYPDDAAPTSASTVNDPSGNAGLTIFDGGGRSKGFVFTPNTVNGYMDFRVGPGGATASALRITGDGNVGIGTTSPGAKLEVNGMLKMSGSNAAITFPDNTTQTSAAGNGMHVYSTSTDSFILFENGGTGGRAYSWDVGSVGAGIGAGNFAIYDVTGGTPRFVVNPLGYIGINTINPQYQLDVNGNIKIEGNGSLYFPDGSHLSSATGLINNGGSSGGSSANLPDISDVSGKVGIGTATPSVPLQVVGTGNVAAFGEASSTNGKQLLLGVNTAGTGYGTIQSLSQGTGYTPLVLNPNGGNIGIGTITPQVALDVAGVINGRNYSFPATFGTASWAKIGTFTGGSGDTIRITAFIHKGYNAQNSMDSTYYISFKSSNDHNIGSVDGNGFAGNGSYYAVGYNNAIPPGSIKWVADQPGRAANTFSLYMYLPIFVEGSHYSVNIDKNASWTDAGTLVASDPGPVASASVMIPPAEFDLPYGNVGIGVSNSAYKLEVAGNMRLSGSNGSLTFPDGSVLTSANTLAAGNGAFSVDGYGKAAIASAQGGPLLSVKEAGAGYANYNAAIIADTDNPNGAQNYAYQGKLIGTTTYSVRSDGQGYFANSIGIRNPAPVGPLDIGGGGGMIVSGANLDPNPALGGEGTAALAAVKDSGRMLLGWNRSGGGRDIDLVAGGGGAGLGGFRFYDYTSGGNMNLLMAMPGNGNVGIGTDSPTSKLEVNGTLKLTASGAPSIIFPDSTRQSTAWNGATAGQDYADSVDVSGDRAQYEPGDVLVIDSDTDRTFRKAAEPYSRLVAGVYSTKPGLVGRRQAPGTTTPEAEVPLAMAGIVPTKVSAENGPIIRGDLLVASSTPGYAMKGTDRDRMPGAILGKALGHLESGTGIIELLVVLQ